MAFLIPFDRPEGVCAPNLSREKILEHLRTDNAKLELKSIGKAHALFVGTIRIQAEPSKKAQYKITCRIPLKDPLFDRDEIISDIQCKRLTSEWVQYAFERYIDNNGFTIY